MYKEFRELTRADAVKALYQDMAARHRARFRSIHVCLSSRSAGSVQEMLMCEVLTDSPRRRDREDRGHPPPIHQAAAHAAPQVPAPPPRPEGPLDLRRAPPRDVLSALNAGSLTLELASIEGSGGRDTATHVYLPMYLSQQPSQACIMIHALLGLRMTPPILVAIPVSRYDAPSIDRPRWEYMTRSLLVTLCCDQRAAESPDESRDPRPPYTSHRNRAEIIALTGTR